MAYLPETMPQTGAKQAGGVPSAVQNYFARVLRGEVAMEGIEEFGNTLSRSMTDPTALLDVVGPGVLSSRIVKALRQDPEKLQKAYKLFRVNERKPGELFPLFVDANKPVPMGEWLRATAGELTDKGKVKSKLGPLAYRPGWHAGDLPMATHIGEGGQPPTHRPANQVWGEVDFPDEFDWQSLANERGTNAQGRVVPVRAAITDQVPYDGFYRYKTNPNMTGEWLIGGDMRVNRLLPDEEVLDLNASAGLADLPRREPFDADRFGFLIKALRGEQ